MTGGAGAQWVGRESFLTWPVRALFGETVPAIAVIALGVGAFVLVVRATSGGFANAARENPEVAVRTRRPAAGSPRAFRSGLAAVVIAKELKLIARDPTLIAKSLVQLLYFVPLMMILVRKSAAADVLAASLVLLASTLAGTFAWIAVSGEEAPDLVGTAPVGAERLRWLKVAAALLPVALVVLPFLAWYAFLSWRLFGIVLLFLAAGLASSAVIQVWAGVPGSGRDLRMRFKKNMLANFVEGMSNLGWAGACYLAITGLYVPIAAALLLGLAGPVTAWISGRLRSG
jgi:ABC-2 type transport system permease protein